MANTQFNVDSLTSLRAFLDYFLNTGDPRTAGDDAARREALCKLDMGRVMEEMIALEAERRRVEEGVRRHILLGREFVAERHRQMGGIMMRSEQMYSLEENDGGQFEEQCCHPLARRPSEARRPMTSRKQCTTSSLLKKTSTEEVQTLEPSPPSVLENVATDNDEVSGLKRKASALSNSCSQNPESSSNAKEITSGQSSASPDQLSATGKIEPNRHMDGAEHNSKVGEDQETANSAVEPTKAIPLQQNLDQKSEVGVERLSKIAKMITKQPISEQKSLDGLTLVAKVISKQPISEHNGEGLNLVAQTIPEHPILEQKSEDGNQGLNKADKPISERKSEAGEQSLKKNHYFCRECEVSCTSLIIYEGHLAGKKHKDMISKLGRAAALVAKFGNDQRAGGSTF